MLLILLNAFSQTLPELALNDGQNESIRQFEHKAVFHDTVIKRVQSFCNSAMKLPPNQINLFNHFIKSIKVSSDG